MNPAFPEPYVEQLLRPRYQGLRGKHHLEERVLDRVHDVGADDDRSRSVSKQRLRDEGVKSVPFMGATEGGDGELYADHEHARAAVVLSEVLGQAQGSAAGRATIELEHGAADVGAEAKDHSQPEICTGEQASALVLTTRWVMSVAGRPHPTMALAAADAASPGAALATMSSRASRAEGVP